MDNKVVIITGAGNGIGKATAIKFAKANANVVIADINDDDLINVIDIIALVNIIVGEY